MTILWSNNASTTVSGSITPTSTTVQLAAGTGVLFPNPTSGNYYVATFYDQATKTQNEIVHVTAMAGDVATIVRAQENTTAKSWGPGDIFANLVTAGTLAAFVQAGTGPANTSLVYVGTDTSTTQGLIIANTNPVPSSLAIGMLFNILVNNTNFGATNVQLNGGTSIPLVRMDGAALLSGDVNKSMETTFVYNGVNFNTMIPDLPRHPAQTVFYVNTAGNDNNTGFANTPTDAFATVQGAINAIKSRYTSQVAITIRVADGNYGTASGFSDGNGYIASWNIVGNTSNPQNVIISGLSTTSGAYIANAYPGRAVVALSGCIMTVQGFYLQSHGPVVTAGGTGARIAISNCWCVAPTDGSEGVLAEDGGSVVVGSGTMTFTGSPWNAFFACSDSATMQVAGYDSAGLVPNSVVTVNFVGNPTVVGGTLLVTNSAVMAVYQEVLTWTGGTPQGPKYVVTNAGGLDLTLHNPSAIPGTQPGTITPPGYGG